MENNKELIPKPPNECDVCGVLIHPRLTTCSDCENINLND